MNKRKKDTVVKHFKPSGDKTTDSFSRKSRAGGVFFWRKPGKTGECTQKNLPAVVNNRSFSFKQYHTIIINGCCTALVISTCLTGENNPSAK